MQSYKLSIFIIVTAVLLLSGCSPKSSTNKELTEMVEQEQIDRLHGYIDKSDKERELCYVTRN
jgi:outer membrane murein-binding lipoprotein Lpp